VALTGKQRRALRALGHHLDPVVQVGREGVSPAVIEAAGQALWDHELIKVKVGEGSPLDRHEVAEALARATGSDVAQVLGRTLLLYRRRAEDPKIELPGGD
jgi:RNA-binding protein